MEKVRSQFLSLRQPSSPTVSPPWAFRRFSPVFAYVLAGTPYRLISFAPFTFSRWPLFSEALYFAHSVRNPFFFIFQALPAWDSVDTSSFSRSSDKASDRIGDARTKQPPRARQSSNSSELGRFRKRARHLRGETRVICVYSCSGTRESRTESPMMLQLQRSFRE
jgi:hypothetical protein